jgi:hypothetical protein
VRRPNIDDWVRESTNLLAGKIARRCHQSKIPISMGIPESVSPEEVRQRIARTTRMRFYPLRTLHGSALVILDGVLAGLNDACESPVDTDFPETSVLLFGDNS